MYLEEKGEVYNPDIYDFSIHKRRAKDIGLFVFTDEYKEELKNKQLLAASNAAVNTSVSTPGTAALALNTSDDAFPGFSSKESSFLSPALPNTPLSSLNNTSMNLTPNVTALSTPQSVPLPQPQPQQQPPLPPAEPGYVYVGALKVQLVDNLFHCPEATCNKNFRKENHLQIHVKHYHEDLAKLLGVCPNMTDLAYQRTIGMPIDEAIPKNQIPNSQFFERVYQSDLNSKAQRKSMSPSSSSVQVKSEHKSPSLSEKLANTPVHTPVIESELQSKLASGANQSVPTEPNAEQMTQVQDCIGLPIKLEPSVPLGVEAEVVNIKKEIANVEKEIVKHVKKENVNAKKRDTSAARPTKATKRRPIKPLNRQKAKKNIKKAMLKTLQDAKSSIAKDLGDANEHRHPAGSTEATSPGKNSRVKFLEPMDNKKAISNEPQIVPEMTAPHPKYIHENGEMIKIVRMRQEEIINCLCSYVEEDGLMIQCELCLCWQHGICNGIEKESQVPEKYVCYICRNPQRGRESMKYVHDQDWLLAGKLPVATYHAPNSKHSERFDMLKQSHTLTGNLIELKRFMHSLKVKINIAENKDHPKMYLWSKKWEKSPTSTDLTGIELMQQQPDKSKFTAAATTNETLNQLFSNPAEEVKITETIKEEQNESTTIPTETTTDMTVEKRETVPIKEEANQSDGAESKPIEFADDKMIVDQSILAGLLHSSDVQNVQQDQEIATVKIPQPEAAINPAECQLRLLDHIQKQQNLVMGRLQTIEAQIIGKFYQVFGPKWIVIN